MLFFIPKEQYEKEETDIFLFHILFQLVFLTFYTFMYKFPWPL